ncbi:MAG: hypothetical protein AB8B94_09750 [Hyphomicrobiales bacterium]
MSKHIFEQTVGDQSYEVQIGWDKPLQRYYGVISPWAEDPDMEEGGYFDDCDPTWSNLFLSSDIGLEDVADACEKLGLIIPDGLLENVVDDMLRNAVNEITIYECNKTRHIDLNVRPTVE